MNDDLQDFYLPERIGHISQSRNFDSPLMIFKIEEAYFGVDTQQSVIELIPYLYQQFDVRVICTDGTDDDFRDLKLRENRSPEQLREALAKGELSAVVYVVLTSGLPLTLYGVENAEQYTKNRQALAQTHYGNKVTLLIRKLKQLIDVLKTSIYATEIYAFDQAIAQHEAGELSLRDLTQLFREHTRKGRIQLDDFSNLSIFIKTLSMEEAIDWSEVEIEREKLVQDMMAILTAPTISIPFLRRVAKIRDEMAEYRPPLELVDYYRGIIVKIQKELIDMALMFREGLIQYSSIYDLMVDISSLCDLNISQYPNLLLYIHYLHQAERIGRQELLEEIEQAKRQIQETLFENDEQRMLARTSRMLEGLYKLCNLEMTPNLFERFKREFGYLTFTKLLQDEYIQKAILPEEQAILTATITSLQDVLQESNRREIGTLFNLLDSLRIDLKGTPEDELKDLEQIIAQLSFTSLLTDTDDIVEKIPDMVNLLDSLEIVPEGPSDQLDRAEYKVESLTLAELLAEKRIITDTLRLPMNFPILKDPLVRGLLRAEIAIEGGYRFSQLATARGRSLVENTLRCMQEQGATMAVLITGGFLTNKILPVLEREMISYKVIMPKADPSKTTAKHYKDSMTSGSMLS